MLQVRKHSGTFLALQQRGKSDTLDRVQPGPDRQAAGLTSLSHVELVSAARLQLGGAQGGNLKPTGEKIAGSNEAIYFNQ